MCVIEEQFPEERLELLFRADRILAGDFSEFCPLATEPQLPFPRWHHDLTTGAEWPVSWARKIDYSSPQRPGEIRHLWDLHRQLFLPALAQAWRLSRDRRYLDRLAALYLDWWRCNPLGRGIGWIGPQIQEHALRNVQWITCFYLLLDDPDVPETLLADLLQGIQLQTAVLDWYYKPDKPVSHNHLVSESLGLWMAGLLFPTLPQAGRWRQRGGEGLRAALDLQFGADGLHKEWASNYHCFVLESALLARCLCAHHGDPLLDGLDERLALAARFAARATQPDGRIPYIGDADDALVYLWSAHPHQQRRRYAATLALLLDNPELAAEAGELPAESVWLVGPDAPERWHALLRRAGPLDPVSVHAGLNTLIAQDDRHGDWLLVHGGPSRIEPKVGSSHLHADWGSVLVWLAGREVWTDPGTWLYNGSDESRHLLRATRSHTTASLEGRDQCDLGLGRFRVDDLPLSEPLTWQTDPLQVRIHTRGRAGAHTRQLARIGRTLVLWDELTGAGEWAETSFITPVTGEREAWSLLRATRAGFTPVQTGSAAWAGGRSRRYGVLEPARRLESRAGREPGQESIRFLHLLLPDGEALPELVVDAAGGLALAWPSGLLSEPGWSAQWKKRSITNQTDTLHWEANPAGVSGDFPCAAQEKAQS